MTTLSSIVIGLYQETVTPGGAPPATSAILMESTGYVLMEDGSLILLE